MNFTLLIVLVLAPIFSLQSPGSARCRCTASDEITRKGANENIVIAPREKYLHLEGVVQDVNGQSLSDVLVEVFDKPDYLLLQYPESEEKKKGQKRLLGCVVGSDGRFCFRNLPAGKYELRFSKDGGWNRTYVYVIVARPNQKASKRGLEITMQVGT